MPKIDISKLTLLKKGKVKNIYNVDESRILFEFSDRVSAFDVVLPSDIPGKGEILCKFASFWFNYLETPNHMIEVIEPNMMIVKRLKIIPIEFIVRGYLYGGLYDRVKKGEVSVGINPLLGAELPNPIFDPTTKSDTKDVQITVEQIINENILTEEEMKYLEKLSMKIYLTMKNKALESRLIICDLKMEFGKDEKGNIILVDSIGPDEFRLWSKDKYKVGQVQESFDKQIVRDWLIEEGFKKRIDDAIKEKKEIPQPPTIPEDIILKVNRRYIEAYELLTS